MTQKKERILVAGILALFFGILCSFGPGHYPDTQGYMDMDMAREPLYPLFLLLCRMLAGKYSLWLAVILQNLFCAVDAYLIYFYVKRMCFPELFGAKEEQCSGGIALSAKSQELLSVLLLASLLLPHLVTPLFSSSRMILSNGIISEGLCYPLYQLFIYQLLKVLWEDGRRMVPAFVLAFLLCLVRGQMMVAIPIWAVTAGYRIYRSYEKKARGILLVLAGTVLLFVGRTPVISLYNLAVHGIYAQNTSNNLTILTNILYASERENGAKLPDATQQELFYRMYDAMEELEYTYHFAGSSMQDRAVHQEYTHDYIKFDVVTPVLKEHVQSLSEEEREGLDTGVWIDRMAGEMAKPLLTQNPGVRIQVYIAVVWCGLIRTAAFLRPGINLVTMVVYVLLAVLCIRTLWRNGQDRTGWFLLFSFMIVCAVVFATGLMIMCLSRYVIYNTSFLYMAALLVLWKTVMTDRIFKGKNRKE
ncbi:MAG: hypothetical protein J6B10_06105 [Lachnospiraceae bacterium]|nr:hypothetical protein [Lachnospiraceae bacterium]